MNFNSKLIDIEPIRFINSKNLNNKFIKKENFNNWGYFKREHRKNV